MRTLASGPGSVRFTVAVPDARIEPVQEAAGSSEIRIAGYGSAGTAGSPALPCRVLHVAVPPVGEVSLSASAGPGEAREGVLLAPPGVFLRGRENEPPRFERSAAAYAATAALAPQRARLVGVSWMRDQRVASVAILPADYEPAARRVTLYREIQVELSFAGGGSAWPPPAPDDPFENVYREALVNYEAGRAWRRPRAAAGAPAALPGAGPARRLAGGPEALGPGVPDTSLFVGRDWIKIAITKTGFYKVGFGQVRNTSLFTSLPGGAESATLASLRLFTLPGNPVLPEDDYCDQCEFREVGISL